ncbi:hypothetical protein C5167_049426 [Papaver somniferum]|uniref:Nucleotide-diphospho-sugar transferase domain-containing protein n=1 Tax=Papaver somniferum TaxID=3469 RepID=A0A4Y7KKS5_PAPSO|nr:hypothetical protein C5167_049426 [Papaver somniferum]
MFSIKFRSFKLFDLRTSGLYWRERGPTESTEFSFSRFLTPYLANYEGWAMFVDCDFLYTTDIKELTELIDDNSEIGSVPFIWNFLVGHNKVDENDPSTQPKAIHYTTGGPWFEMWKNCEFADLWLSEMEAYKKETKQV